MYSFIKNNYEMSIAKDKIGEIISKCHICPFYDGNRKGKIVFNKKKSIFEKIGIDCTLGAKTGFFPVFASFSDFHGIKN